MLLLYSKLKKDLQERLNARGKELQFTVAQIRSELKKLIGECKKVALTVKTATGIDDSKSKRITGRGFLYCFLSFKAEIPVSPNEQWNHRPVAVKMFIDGPLQVQPQV